MNNISRNLSLGNLRTLTRPFSLYLTRGKLSAEVGGAGDSMGQSNLTAPGEKDAVVAFHGLGSWGEGSTGLKLIASIRNYINMSCKVMRSSTTLG